MAYVYPLLVLLEENSIPGLKNRLLQYFHSWISNEGDCEMDYENGSSIAMLRFRREEDQKNVLSQKVHQINLDKGVLKMTVQLPSEKKTVQEDSFLKGSKYYEIQAKAKCKDDEEPCSTSTVLENVSESMNKKFLEMQVDKIIKNLGSPTASKYRLEVIPDISCAVVTFQNGKDNTDFMARWPQNWMSRTISIRPLEVTKQVEGVSNNNTDVHQLYFENEGGEVEDEAEQSAAITYKSHQAVSAVMKMKHQIKKEEFKAYPFQKSLAPSLLNQNRRTRIPPAFHQLHPSVRKPLGAPSLLPPSPQSH